MLPDDAPALLDPAADARRERLFRIVFWTFVGTIVFSTLGTLALKAYPPILLVFARMGIAYPSLVKGPTWLYNSLLPLLPLLAYARTHPKSQLAFFALWGTFCGGMSELMGTSTGFPFGAYAYGDWLGPKFLDHVPYLIPPSWFAMSLLSLDLASRVTSRRAERIVVAAVFMTLWDVALDPAMSRAFPMWTYPGGGFFFGMPISNWAGWFGVALVIAFGYEVIGGGLRATTAWAPLLYALNGLFPLLVSLLHGLPEAAAIGAVAVAMPLLAVRAQGVALLPPNLLRRAPRRPPPKPVAA
ncbi:MAG: carotenoid biosynthesis protein [Bacteroidetes bacterium]|nr:carotenoid biosynthesis protein [Bacteroidota bacterium]